MRARLEKRVADGTIRVVTMGTHGVTGFGGFGFEDRAGAGAADEGDGDRAGRGGAERGGVANVDDAAARAAAQAGKNPSKGIVIEPED